MILIKISPIRKSGSVEKKKKGVDVAVFDGLPRAFFLNVAVKGLLGHERPAEDQSHAGEVDPQGPSSTGKDLGPVGRLRLLGDGQPLEGVRLKGAHGGAHGRHQRELAALGDVAEGDTGDDGRHDFCCVFFFEEGRVVCRCRVTERKVAGIQEDGVVMFLKGTDGRCCVILCGDAGEGELVTREACSATLFLYLPGTSLNDHGLAPAGGGLIPERPLPFPTSGGFPRAWHALMARWMAGAGRLRGAGLADRKSVV